MRSPWGQNRHGFQSRIGSDLRLWEAGDSPGLEGPTPLSRPARTCPRLLPCEAAQQEPGPGPHPATGALARPSPLFPQTRPPVQDKPIASLPWGLCTGCKALASLGQPSRGQHPYPNQPPTCAQVGPPTPADAHFQYLLESGQGPRFQAGARSLASGTSRQLQDANRFTNHAHTLTEGTIRPSPGER